jgi:diguanylate cyclase (GGDEF)-like protein/PAS domain S-box-containing protein
MPDGTSPFIDVELAGSAAPLGPGANQRRREETEARVAEISSLLSALEEAAAEPSFSEPHHAAPAPAIPPAPRGSDDHEVRLVQVRLGMASSLYTALRHKHAATASHSLRVALGCSAWALYKRLDDDTRDVVELAALLHDVGKIGVPDGILAKCGPLSDAEEKILARHCEAGANILACCCSAQRILDAVYYAGVRFDGGGSQGQAIGDRLPLEARMIAIVDAFDALTAGQANRPALPREQALAALAADAGKRFDPILVKQFTELLSHEQDALTQQIAGRWFNELGKKQSELPWASAMAAAATAPAPAPLVSGEARSAFEQQLIDAMQDGIVFVDARSVITLWSKGAERLTGVSSTAATGRQFTPGLLDMCNTAGRRVRDDACPVARSLESGNQLRQRLEILGRDGGHVAIDLHVIPVHTDDGTVQGATILLHDAEPEASLEEKCEALHARATKDPMTKVANRAEFDRMQALFMEAHQQAGQPCSLIMTDIDHFKSINDTYGHQAGDEAIITVANLLQQMCRAGDLVARYGGEEFAVLCADCSAADAAKRAEQIRRKLSETPHACLGNKRITASFGVSELQPGDTTESLLRRADQALLLAKEKGRNQVLQSGSQMEQQPRKKKWWSFGTLRPQPILETTLSTEVPIDVAIEKLRGFVSDQRARVVSTRDNRIELEISSENMGQQRRQGDRAALFRIELEFSEQRLERKNNVGLAAGRYALTVAKVTIRPRRARSRRKNDHDERARLILQSLKAYLMAHDAAEDAGAALSASK